MPRRLIVCADGTWNTPDAPGGKEPPPTNVVKLARAIAPIAPDGTSQIVLYHEGVGNGMGLTRWLGGAGGFGLSRNVRACYRFLVDNYAPGDELYFFGFSRGAYTVRSLVGMIRNSGLLRAEYAHLIPQAYDLYRSRSRTAHPNSVEAKTFRANFSHDVRVTCLGVWDSVGALGLPTVGPLGAWTRRKYGFHDVALSSIVDHAYHALAIDEERKPFQPAIWEVDTPGQDVEQMWFAGVHANVGGGYDDAGLSDIALEWMMEKARQLGLAFNDGYVQMAVCGACEARLHDSLGIIYRLLNPLCSPAFKSGRRVISAPRAPRNGRPVRTAERVHASVFERSTKVTSPPAGPYAPPNIPPNLSQPRMAYRAADAQVPRARAQEPGAAPGAELAPPSPAPEPPREGPQPPQPPYPHLPRPDLPIPPDGSDGPRAQLPRS